MKGNFHVRFLEESGREIAPSYSAKSNNDLEGRGMVGGESQPVRLNRGSKFALT
jgi:hypothetical protein